MKKEYMSPKLVEYGDLEKLTGAGYVDKSADVGCNYLTGYDPGDPNPGNDV